MSDIKIRKTTPDDLAEVTRLLRAATLPTEGVADHFDSFLVAENSRGIVGAIGLELYDDVALLRSAVVETTLRNAGIGSLLYARVLEHAKHIGVHRVILLTDTAEHYFARKGFRKIDQMSVAGPIRTSAEFTGACPSIAVCMELVLTEK